jgi:hypothetical protein
MTTYTAQCRHTADERIQAYTNGTSVILDGYNDGECVTAPYLPVEEARTFARGILALCDEVDGGEKPAEEVVESVSAIKVGDRVRIVHALYREEHHGKIGVITSTTDTWEPRHDVVHPFRVKVDSDPYDFWAANVELVNEPTDTPSDPRAELITRADKVMESTGLDYTAADIIALARFLAGE